MQCMPAGTGPSGHSCWCRGCRSQWGPQGGRSRTSQKLSGSGVVGTGVGGKASRACSPDRAAASGRESRSLERILFRCKKSLPRLPDVCPCVMSGATSLNTKARGASKHPQGRAEGPGNAATCPEYYRLLLGHGGLDPEVARSPTPGPPGTAGHFQSTRLEPQAALSTKSPVCRVLPPCSGVRVKVAIAHGGGGGKVGGSGPTQAPPLSTARALTL